MAALYASLAGSYLSIIDDTWPLSWNNSVDLDVWHEPSDKDSGKWLLRLNDRKYAEAPAAPLTLSNVGDERASFVVEGGLPHWITSDRIGIHGEVFLDKAGEWKLMMRQEKQGMTGLETWDFELKKATEARGAASNQAATDPKYDSVLERIKRDFAAPNSQPRKPRIDALAIVKNGQPLFETYLWGMTPATPHIISSCTKSVTSLLAGIAIEQGLFSLDDKIVDHFPDISSTWGEEPATLVRHVLSMTAGTNHTPVEAQKLLESTDVEQFVLSLERVTKPGTSYNYDNGLPALIGCLIERRSGIPLESFAEKHLFGPLGIKDCTWTRMPKPSRKRVTDSPVLGAGGVFLSLPSFIKIGELLLHNGVHEGHQLVPKSYILAATSRQTVSSDYPYGFYFHLNDLGKNGREAGKGEHLDGVDGYFMLGQGLQVVFVAPDAGIVVGAFSSSWHREAVDRPVPWAIFGGINDAIMKSLER